MTIMQILSKLQTRHSMVLLLEFQILPKTKAKVVKTWLRYEELHFGLILRRDMLFLLSYTENSVAKPGFGPGFFCFRDRRVSVTLSGIKKQASDSGQLALRIAVTTLVASWRFELHLDG